MEPDVAEEVRAQGSCMCVRGASDMNPENKKGMRDMHIELPGGGCVARQCRFQTAFYFQKSIA